MGVHKCNFCGKCYLGELCSCGKHWTDNKNECPDFLKDLFKTK